MMKIKSDNETLLRAWLSIHFAPKLTMTVLKRVLSSLASPEEVVACRASTLRSLGLTEATITALKHPDKKLIDEALLWCDAHRQHHLVTWGGQYYPPLLRYLYNPPKLLYVRGQVASLIQPTLAMVGSRYPTPSGAEIASELAADLVQMGFNVVSGLALGIDAASHRGVLAVHGSTVAILGNGLCHLYPARHRDLADKLCESGAIISEFPLQVPPRRPHFPQRNRLISGMSYGVVVVEASLRSGSLITARFANEQGRSVYAVPGSPRNPCAAGCHQLIQSGALLVTCARQIMEDLLPQLPPCQGATFRSNNTQAVELDNNCLKLLQCIGFETTSLDQIITYGDYSVAEATTLLLNLELHGYIKQVTGGYIRVKA